MSVEEQAIYLRDLARTICAPVMVFLEHVHSAKHVHCDTDLGLIITWKGGATFNVWDMWNFESTDCFARCHTPEGYGPADDVPWGEVKRWVERTIECWYEDNIETGEE